MRKTIPLFLAIAAAFSISGMANKCADQAQVTLQNNTQYDLCLYVDNLNNLACGPAPTSGGTCVANVESGNHVLIVATVDGKESASTDAISLSAGDTKIVSASAGDDGRISLSVR